MAPTTPDFRRVRGPGPGCSPDARCGPVTDWLREHCIDCPFCGEPIVVVLDLSAGPQTYVEDCQVCCHPIDMHVEIEDDQLIGLRATRGS